ncbi:MAG TPA: NADH-ubiquinone oxidoreductase-F iron-sulfur binding region domain-containing protein [Gemmataceae bacterium]|nr:NADH-ubiquinone oxidoreductase-F iron-sulfur binding region domain-containing protein [Gemmataceae bacterium]
MILQALNEIQDRCGYLPADELRALAARLNEPLHRVHELASFYPRYHLTPPAAVEVRVCRDMVCHLRGVTELRRTLATLAGELAPGQVRVSGASCLGQCDRAPSVLSINDQVYRGLSEAEIRTQIETALAKRPLPRQHADRSRCGWMIDPYEGRPTYAVVRRLVEGGDSDAVLREIETAELRGMGGAGFPTARKWAAVRSAPGEVKYVICNADESEPGTFKDRELLRRVPHLVIEGMVTAGLVTGAARGYVYIRHEYHDEIDAIREAIRQAEAAGVCGEQLLGSGRSFPVEVFISPGGYIQGEESALLEAMEDRRGEPRNKPPFPVTHGLYGQPTVINNVETLAWVPVIVLRGGAWYRGQGVNGATGLRFVSVSGDVNRPGTYEVPLGQTVRELVLETAGGVRDGQRLKAIATSGPSGGFLPAFIKAADLPEKFVKERLPAGAAGLDILDLTLDWQTLASVRGMLGAAFVVYGDRADMVEQALNCVEFYRNESCGKCVPCRLGSQQLVNILTDLRADTCSRERLAGIGELAETMYLTSICGLGQVAANPITSVLKYFPEAVARYLRQT